MRLSRIATTSAVPLAVLVAVVSLGGLLSPAYARETPAWTAQAIGQDWFDLLVVVPWIALCGVKARQGSYRWSVLLAGAYAYTTYEMILYAFAIHFNALFLLYCATLGLSGFALAGLVLALSRRGDHVDLRGAHLAGAFLIAIGAAFALLWLAEDVPALLHNTPPQSLVDTGLLTNPVHVIDLAFVLPLHVFAGVWIWQGRNAGKLVAPIVLAFGALMAASIGGMLIVMQAHGAPAAMPVALAMFVVAGCEVAVLARLLRARFTPAFATR